MVRSSSIRIESEIKSENQNNFGIKQGKIFNPNINFIEVLMTRPK
jgi:hypothetical protein